MKYIFSKVDPWKKKPPSNLINLDWRPTPCVTKTLSQTCIWLLGGKHLETVQIGKLITTLSCVCCHFSWNLTSTRVVLSIWSLQLDSFTLFQGIQPWRARVRETAGRREMCASLPLYSSHGAVREVDERVFEHELPVRFGSSRQL